MRGYSGGEGGRVPDLMCIGVASISADKYRSDEGYV